MHNLYNVQVFPMRRYIIHKCGTNITTATTIPTTNATTNTNKQVHTNPNPNPNPNPNRSIKINK